jgi:hypothetical protein
MSLLIDIDTPEYWTNDIKNLGKLFLNAPDNTTNYFLGDTDNFILFHKPFDNTAELLELYPQGESDIIIKSWIKHSGESIESDMLSLMCMLSENSESHTRLDILNPDNALKPSYYSWNTSGGLNAHISIMSYAAWLSQWFNYRDFLINHSEITFPISLPESYVSELNFIIDSTYLVSILLEGLKYRAIFWDISARDLLSLNHKYGIMGYREIQKIKVKKQYNNVSPTFYGLKSPSDMLDIIYTQDILPNL